jgi:hypothetical protein
MGEAKLRKKLGLPPRDRSPHQHESQGWHLLMAFLCVWRLGVKLPDKKGHCMMATRLAAEILRRLGFQVEPERVWLEIARTETPEIFVGCPAPDRQVGTIWEPHVDPVDGQVGAFQGHIVLRVQDWFLEVAVGQFASPRDRIAPSAGYAMPFWPWARKDLKAGGIFVNPMKDLSYRYTPVVPTFDVVPWRAAWDAMLASDSNITPQVLDRLVAETRRVAGETTAADYI